MTQVKIFYETYVGMLEEKMNKWLQDMQGKIEIVNITSDTGKEAKIIYIFYKIKDQRDEEKITYSAWDL